MRTFNKLLIVTCLLSLICACGITSPDYIDYTEEEGSDPAANDPCVQAALTEFTAKIQPAIESSCATCHATQSVMKLAKGKDSDNRTNLLKAKNYSSLFAYLGGDHPGGNKQADLAEENITAWQAKEAECSSG